MRNIATYIEYTLMTRHYVFVPGIGGFLLRDVDASYVNRVYTPSHREVHFNRFLTNDDGMLANTYMQAEGITYDEAISQIRIEVATIKSAIEKKKSFVLGNLGILSYDADKHLVVKNSKHYSIDPDCYGLDNLNIKTWKEIENELSGNNVSTYAPKADVVSIPKYWLQRAAAVIILICLFANWDSFTNKNTIRLDYAAIFDKEILFGNTAPYLLETQNKDLTWENEVVLSQEDSSDVQLEAIVNTEEVTLSQTTDAVVETTAVQPIATPVTSNKVYYIIIASCSSYPEAERLVKKRESEGYENVGILERDGRCRLYLKSFTNRAEGEEYLEQVRVSTPFQKAWLLPVRQESLLSYNLKNIDNDQLPMELSHTYQRTERDKGWINT